MLRADMDRGAQHVPNEKRASSGGVSRDVGPIDGADEGLRPSHTMHQSPLGRRRLLLSERVARISHSP